MAFSNFVVKNGLTVGNITANALTSNLTVGNSATIGSTLSATGNISGAAFTVNGGASLQPTQLVGVLGIPESVSISSDAGGIGSGGSQTISLVNGSVWYWTANSTTNYTLNFTWDSGITTYSNTSIVGQSRTVVTMGTNGASAFYPNVVQIDGTTTNVTVKWQGGTAVSAGNANSVDVYSFTIIKTAATPTYTVLASQTKFA